MEAAVDTRLNANVLTVEYFDHPAVQAFDCREDRSRPATPWEADVNEWLNAPAETGDGARFRMTKAGGRCKVWLYTASNEDGSYAVVGYGSLAESKWPDPNASDLHQDVPRVPVTLIPSVGIQTPYQGGPPGVPPEEKYSTQIIQHLISQARERLGERQPFLVLYVHPENARAIRFYRRNGFDDFPKTYRNSVGTLYQAMILKLSYYRFFKSDR